MVKNEIWMEVNKDTKARELYEFINIYLSFNEVVELFRLLKYKMDFHIDPLVIKEYEESE